MKVLYFLAGLFLGSYVTSVYAVRIIEIVDMQWADQISARTLTGYYEGWARGRDYTEARLRYQMRDLHEQLFIARRAAQAAQEKAAK